MRGGGCGLGIMLSGLYCYLRRYNNIPIRPKPLMPTLQANGEVEIPRGESLVEGAMIM